MAKTKLLFAIGTRPEAIKMAPLVQAFKGSDSFETVVLATAQHRGLLDQVLDYFEIKPDLDLNIMAPNQSLPTLTARLLAQIDETLAKIAPQAVIAQGDTTTVFTTALACFYRGIPFFHVEAGLRTGDLQSPFPEEMNRVFVGRLATLHFAPTEGAKANLLMEKITRGVYVTGNTVVDALKQTVARKPTLDVALDPSKRLILMTSHRRENFGEPMNNIFKAIRRLVERYDDIQVLFPVHPNPHVRQAADAVFKGIGRVKLVEPLDYPSFVAATNQAYLILTDSGGVQEEAPALGKPVLVLRTETERPEAVDAGVVKIVGTDPEKIFFEACRLLDDPVAYKAMAKGVSPYGDGFASQRVLEIVRDYFKKNNA